MGLDQAIRIIKRHSEPTKLDTADYLTLCCLGCCVDNDVYSCNSADYYIQLSRDSENPRWQYLGCCPEALLKLIDFLK